ncbi:hypothetical protein XcuCFBP2542_04820 [Xanthomonas cucurbitae]|uniref:Uncharacterized protein n=1 Tax=Xanthomonas cucurbitae TaxID=56453 RepID=A0A2S7DVI6_9XANT|nr:hypothetical protein XcuCFBP2542_04820 [Xanthomonas cucurbitae]QHG88275.1 hypothetical protein EBN15_16310 [Xanthomonas cucurbitae]
MSRDSASPPGEFVHRSGSKAANPALCLHTARLALVDACMRFSRRIAGSHLPFPPTLSPACDGQP